MHNMNRDSRCKTANRATRLISNDVMTLSTVRIGIGLFIYSFNLSFIITPKVSIC